MAGQELSITAATNVFKKSRHFYLKVATHSSQQRRQWFILFISDLPPRLPSTCKRKRQLPKVCSKHYCVFIYNINSTHCKDHRYSHQRLCLFTQYFYRSLCTCLLSSPSGLSSKSSSSSSDPTEYSDWLSEISACHSETADSRVSHTFTHTRPTACLLSLYMRSS